MSSILKSSSSPDLIQFPHESLKPENVQQATAVVNSITNVATEVLDNVVAAPKIGDLFQQLHDSGVFDEMPAQKVSQEPLNQLFDDLDKVSATVTEPSGDLAKSTPKIQEKLNAPSGNGVEDKRPYYKKVVIGTGIGAIAALVALVAFAIFFPPLGVGFSVGVGVAGAALLTTLSAICIRNAFKAANHT